MNAHESYHFIGIGGAGMAPLAEILLQRGVTVSGSDQESGEKTDHLARAGATVFIGHAADHLPENCTAVIYSSAIPEENPERKCAQKRGILQLRRGEFLARLADAYRRPAAISGSHGKSSVTAMLTHILVKNGLKPGYLIGAALTDGGNSSHAGQGSDLFVTEVDESDGTHTLIHPALGIVPNVEDDHSWSVGGEEALRNNFAEFGQHSRTLLYVGGPIADELYQHHPHTIRLEPRSSSDRFDIWVGFQAWNARLAVEAAVLLGVERTQAITTLRDFGGVSRRMTVHYTAEKLEIIEDYAHHPTEVASSLAWLRARYNGYHLRVLFQPHRYARLQKYLPQLANVLQTADSVYLTPVFAAWSENGPVGSLELAQTIGSKAFLLNNNWSVNADILLTPPQNASPLLLAVIGAGDLNHIFPYLPPNIKTRINK